MVSDLLRSKIYTKSRGQPDLKNPHLSQSVDLCILWNSQARPKRASFFFSCSASMNWHHGYWFKIKFSAESTVLSIDFDVCRFLITSEMLIGDNHNLEFAINDLFALLWSTFSTSRSFWAMLRQVFEAVVDWSHFSVRSSQKLIIFGTCSHALQPQIANSYIYSCISWIKLNPFWYTEPDLNVGHR